MESMVVTLICVEENGRGNEMAKKAVSKIRTKQSKLWHRYDLSGTENIFKRSGIRKGEIFLLSVPYFWAQSIEKVQVKKNFSSCSKLK